MLLGPILLALAAAGTVGDYDDIRALIEGGRVEEALEALEPLLEEKPRNGELHELMGEAVLKLERPDAAAMHLALALRYAGDDKKRARALQKRLSDLDPLHRSQRSFYAKATDLLGRSAQDLVEEGHEGLGAALMKRIAPHVSGKERDELVKLASKLAGANTALDLDEETDEAEARATRPLVVVEGEHYKVKANLERELVELIARTLDGIFDFYVEVYLDGDSSRASFPEATIRIYGSWASMVREERGPDADVSPGLGGWWSPAENKVVLYDTRDRTGSLDFLLSTLFHEASHQFMTFLCIEGRGFAPAWINEGTGCFFEGAIALKGGGVLWPDASVQRLRELSQIIQQKDAPKLADVIAYGQPGSYEGRYYPFGWAIVYYLMEYEDPATGEHPYRKLYSHYREKVTTSAHGSFDPLAVFEEVFLGDASPRGHASLDDFEVDWRQWVMGEVRPLHIGRSRRELRVRKIEEYMERADAAREAGEEASERELLGRALAHAEVVVRELDVRKTDGDLLELQIAILGRLDRPLDEAAVINDLLDLADSGEHELDEGRYKELEDRLKGLDKRYASLRLYKSRRKMMVERALGVIAKYEQEESPLYLTAAEFARSASALLDDGDLALEAERLAAAAEDR